MRLVIDFAEQLFGQGQDGGEGVERLRTCDASRFNHKIVVFYL